MSRRDGMRLARVFWLVVAVPTLVILGAAALHDRALDPLSSSGWTPDTYRLALAQLGLQAVQLDIVYALSTNLVRLGFLGVALILFLRSDEPMVFFTSLTLLTFSVTAGGAVGSLPGGLAYLIVLIQILGQTCLMVFLFVFPTGHFVPGWLRWPTLAAIAVETVLARVPGMQSTLAGSALLWLATLWLLASALPSQIYRNRRVSSLVERQQTKLVVFGIAVFLVFSAGSWLAADYILPGLAPAAVPAAGSGARLWYDFAVSELQVLPTFAIPLTLGLAIRRYRLWEVDVIIRRTLVYAVLTGLLALAYFGSVLVLQSGFGALTGQAQSTLVTVLSTLVIAALFVPLRRRVQAVIDRRLYRRKYDSAKTLAMFAVNARDDVNLDDLTNGLLSVVDETMRPAGVTLWLKK